MKEKNSSNPVGQPGCGYYFSSGFCVSETVYSSAGCISHGPLYNAASRVIVDGGKKAAAYIAMAGMLIQNMDIAAYAGGIYHTVTHYDSGAVFSGLNTNGTYWTISGNSAFGFVIQNSWLNAKGGYVWSPVLNSNGHLVISGGGQASGAEVNAGGEIAVKSDGIISNTVLYAGGTANISGGGIAETMTVSSGGAANIYAGGSAAGITQSGGGNINAIVQGVPGISAQYVSGRNQEGSSFTLSYDNESVYASNFIINDGGWQYVSRGGKTVNAYINVGGIINVYSGGQAENPIVNGGTLTVYSGGTAEFAAAGNGGMVNLSGGTANYAFISAAGIMNISRGTALLTTVSSGGTQNVFYGGSAIGTVLSSGGNMYTMSGGTDTGTVIYSGGKHTVSDEGLSLSAVIVSGGSQFIYNGGSAIGTVLSKGGKQVVSAGGIANDTVVNSSGFQYISSGGTANDTVVNWYGSQIVSSGGTANSTVLNSSGFQIVFSGGTANGTVVNGYASQIVSSGGTANGTTIKSYGNLLVASGGRAINIIQNSGGKITAYVIGGDTATYITGSNERGTFKLENGVANNFVLNDGAKQYISNAGIASGTVANYGGRQYISSGGIAVSAVLNRNGYQVVDFGGIATGTVINGEGVQYVTSGGSSYMAKINPGGSQYINNGGTATSTTVSGGWQRISSGGTANYTLVAGCQEISPGAMAIGTVVSSGWQYVKGIASGTTVNSGAFQFVGSGGQATDAVVNGIQYVTFGGTASATSVGSGGFQYVGSANNTGFLLSLGGIVSGTVIDSGGKQVVYESGIAIGTDISGYASLDGSIISSGIQTVSSGGLALSTTIHQYGSQEVLSGGIASSTLILNGGWQIINSGGSAIDYVIETGGSQVLKDGAYASGAYVYGDLYVSNGAVSEDDLIESGRQHVLYGGTALRAVIKGTGQQIVSAGGSASGTNIYSAGSQSVLAGGTADYATINESGTQNVYGTAASAQVNNLGVQRVASGGSADFTQINNGGQQILESAGMATQTIINEGGLQRVGFRGTAINTTVDAGGSQIVYNEGQAASTYINSGGLQIINTNGKATSSYVSGGGLQEISGGTEISGTLSGVKSVTATLYAEQKIYDGGIAKNIAISKLAKQEIYSGGTAESATVYASGSQTVLSGGIASSSIINSGGSQNVSSGGTAYNADVRFGGTQNVNIGGMADSTVISGSGSFWAHQYVGGTANDTVINQLAAQTVSGNAFRTVVNSGGSQLINVNGTAMSTTVSSGGSQNVYGSTYITEIKGSGIQNIYPGGTANFTIVSSGGSQVIEAGGSAMHNILFDVNNQTAATGATFINHVVSAENISVISSTHTITNSKAEYNIFIATHGYQHISSGGLALATTLNGGGFAGVARQYVYSGGIALSTTVNDLGFVRVISGGSAISTVISAEGEASAFMTVLAGGYASGIVVQGGTNAKLLVGENDEDTQGYWTAAGGTVYDVAVENGGRAVVYGTNALHGRTVLNSGGTIAHGWLNSGESSGTAGTLTVENLIADGGIVRLPVKLDAGSAAAVGHIKITESHSGAAYIYLNRLDSGTPGPISGNELMLVEYADGADIAAGASFALIGGTNTYEEGDYVYTLQQGSNDSADDKDYYLRSTGQNTNGANNAGSVPDFTGAGIGAALNSLQKRLGDLRGLGGNAERHGIWGRSYYKNMTVKAHENVKMDVSGLEAGYDFKLSGYDYSGSNYQNTGLYLGLMAASINISADGKGDGEGLLGGGYATYLAENGWFADFTLRGGNAEMDVITHTNIGTRIQISPERSFIAASIEAGKTLDLRKNGKGWKIEPKAEVQYMAMGSKDTETNTLIPVHYGGVNYYTGIGTVYASYTSMRQNGMMTEPFAEITYKYEFDGEEKVKYQTANLTSDTGGSTIEGRIGMNMQLTPSLYWHAAASYEDGHSVKSYGADAGIRYMFGGK